MQARTSSLAVLALSLFAPLALATPQIASSGGGPLLDRGPSVLADGAFGECISKQQRAEVRNLIDEYHAAKRAAGVPEATSVPYTFYPMGGRHYRDVYVNNFVDLDGSGGTLDWNCTDRTYDGHLGSDNLIRSFGEQLVGVPIFAALDGTVIARADGNPDMNVVWAGQPANYVLVDHGGGRTGYYWHMKNGSVAVSPGQNVVAGQQLGLVASSGNSNWPHLHFESEQGAANVEPYAGPCRVGVSEWTNQIPIDYSTIMWDFGWSDTTLAGHSLPNEFPRTGQWAQTNTFVYLWIMLESVPASSTYRIRIHRPDATLASDSGVTGFGNPSEWRLAWWWWTFNIPDMHTIAGTWTVDIMINGTLMVDDAPLDVVPTTVPGFNQAPLPISVSFDPASPVTDDVVVCNVDTSVLDDYDYDIVRYRYLWKVDGNVVRDVTSAAQSDALPSYTAPLGSTLSCEVTPGDGTDNGPTATTSVNLVTNVVYCTSGTTGNGCRASISGTGTPSASAGSGFDVTVSAMDGKKQGILFYGISGSNAFPWGSGTSFLCVKTPTQRAGVQASGGTSGQCNGQMSIDWNAFIVSKPNALGNPFTSGSNVWMQGWFRDPPSPKTTSLSNGLAFTVQP